MSKPNPGVKLLLLGAAGAYAAGLFFLSNAFFRVWDGSDPALFFVDYVHNMVLPLTNFLAADGWARHVLLGVDSFFIDICASGAVLVWVVYGVSKSLVFSIVIFYSIRTLGMSLCQWPLPEFIVFEDPGFPSLLVSYAMTNDLYFSGHTGIMTIVVLEAWLYFRSPVFVAVALATLLYTVFTLTVLHAHFLNDILIGFVAAVWVQQIVYRYRYSLTLGTLRLYAWMFKNMKGEVIIVEDVTWFDAQVKKELY